MRGQFEMLDNSEGMVSLKGNCRLVSPNDVADMVSAGFSRHQFLPPNLLNPLRIVDLCMVNECLSFKR